MESFHFSPFLREVLILLVAGGVAVPLFNRLKVSPVLGYLLVGFIVGPHGLGSLTGSEVDFLHYFTISSTKDVALLAEFGITFLMFTIGLELSLKRLWSMRKLVFGLGLLQVLLTILVFGGGSGIFLGTNIAQSFVIGAALASSSTAIVMQILTERRLIATPIGRNTFSILLFQDLAVVPVLILIGVMAQGVNEGIGITLLWTLGKSVAAVLVLLLFGRFLLRPIFRLAGSAKGAEPFMAVSFLSVIVSSIVTGQAGLSMALGAFLGGLLLSETEYRHAIEVYIEPFKGLFLGLFFMTVGMGIDPIAIGDNAVWLAACVVGLVLIKSLIITALANRFGSPPGQAAEVGLLLAQAGEFAFVIIGTALAAGILHSQSAQFLSVLTGLTMALAPLLANVAPSIRAWIEARTHNDMTPDSEDSIPEMHGHIVIAGFGRVGKAIAAIFDAEEVPYMAVETNTAIIKEEREAGHLIIYGDAVKGDLLKHCHPEHAQAVLITMADTKIAKQIIHSVRDHWPELPIYTRACDLKAACELRKAGSSVVVAETLEASLQLASSVLKGTGSGEESIKRRMALSREMAFTQIEADVAKPIVELQ